MFKSSHRPDGRLTFCLLFAGRWCSCPGRHSDHLIVRHQRELCTHSICARSSSKVPIAPMGKLLTCLPRLTLAQLRTLRSTTGCACHRNLENFPSPRWENAFLTSPFRFSSFMMDAASNYNQPRVRPSVPETSKVPIAPMGELLTRLPRLTLAQLRTLRSTTVCTCHRDLENFPSPRWENAFLTCPFRFSSFMMGAASNYQPLVRPSVPETSKVPIAPMGNSRFACCL